MSAWRVTARRDIFGSRKLTNPAFWILGAEAPVCTENSITAMKSPFSGDAALIYSSN
jgi:hypothetical protein